ITRLYYPLNSIPPSFPTRRSSDLPATVEVMSIRNPARRIFLNGNVYFIRRMSTLFCSLKVRLNVSSSINHPPFQQVHRENSPVLRAAPVRCRYHGTTPVLPSVPGVFRARLPYLCP